VSFVAISKESALEKITAAGQAGHLTATAVENLRVWINEPAYAEYAPLVLEHVAGGQWQTLDNVFWTVIPFGTGGRRGKMYPIGSNAINDRTIGESAQGLASYVKEVRPTGSRLVCAIAYDTRHRSREFAELCSEIMVAAGFTVYFLDGFRSTPELSFAVRAKACSCGIMITASHNPPSDNAVKVYWSTGGQLLPPHDSGVIERVMSTTTIERVPFAKALAEGRVIYCQEEIDRRYQQQVLAQSVPGPRKLKIIYSPMHGVGAASVLPVLAAAGFEDVELFGPHAEPHGDFPNVPGHVSNPENPDTFESIIARAKEVGADLILSTDPDADRLGCAAPLASGQWQTFTGNQIGALLTEFLLEGRKKSGRLTADDYVVKTLVTTELVRRIATSYGVATHGNLQVGFKYIGGAIDEYGPEHFLLGTEESHGYLVGDYARDKDATVAALLLAELAAAVKADRGSLHDKLDSLFWQHGCHAEATVSKTMPGSEGMGRMQTIMAALRSEPPRALGGLPVIRMRDYLHGQTCAPGAKPQPLVGPRGDMVMLDLDAEGNYLAVRPSGTEPKMKFYLFSFEPAEMLGDLDRAKESLADRLKRVGEDLSAWIDAI
jgi:phosphomannomutase